MESSTHKHDSPKGTADSIGRQWHCLSVHEVAASLRVDPARGLAASQVKHRLRRHGPNRLRQAKAIPWFRVLADQFRNIVVVLLAAAAAICLVIGEQLEGYSILVVLLLNGAIGFVTEYKANRAVEALQKLGSAEAVVVRSGRKQKVSTADIVPGDVLALEEGQSVPADARVIESAELQVDESSLTGESVPVYKKADVVEDPQTPLAERVNMLYRGTSVASGNGRACVVATGMDTEIGRTSELVGRVEDEETPLEKRLAGMVRKLIVLCLGVAVVFAVSGIVQGVEVWLMAEAAIALAIAAIPEGLPAVTTITLALGMRRMARRNALIRRLPAVETLGSVTCVCTDKTGTLTRGEMTVRALALAGRDIRITGSGYAPLGRFEEDGEPLDVAGDRQVSAALTIAALCNNASLGRDAEGSWEITGDPTEAALLAAAQKAGLPAAGLRESHPRRKEYPFSSREMMMGTVNEGLGADLSPGEGLVLCVKGSPEPVLERCTKVLAAEGVVELTQQAAEKVEGRNHDLAGEGSRVLGLAFRSLEAVPRDRDEALRDLTWVALAGIIDPPRQEASRTVDVLTRAGISTAMITGDQPRTAAAIAAELHIAPAGGPVVAGKELDGLDDDALADRLEDTEVFARVSPEQKVRILEGLQRRGRICAMLGDGVNDAAALKAADIGVAMGIRGTDVAKETADMVLLDDLFSTVAAAVREGRVIYDNIRKCIAYLFSCNLSEILTMLLASLLGHPLPLLPLQILWLNLITDVFPALALAVEPGEEGIMERPPADPRKPLISSGMARSISIDGVIITLSTVAAFIFGTAVAGYTSQGGVNPAVTMSFLTIAFSQLFHVFNARKATSPLGLSELLTNFYAIGAVLLSAALMMVAVYVPFVAKVLKTARPTPVDWAVILGLSLVPVAVGQVRRRVWFSNRKRVTSTSSG